MADTHVSAALVFDGVYGDLARLGLPIPIVLSLQSQHLTLESPMWNARCSHAGFSVTLFWPTSGNEKRDKKRKRTRHHMKTTQTKVCPSEKEKEDPGSTPEDPAPSTTPINAPIRTPHLPPDTPAVCKSKNGHLATAGYDDDSDDPAVLDKIVQCGQNIYDKVEFVMEEGIGPALKFADKGGGIAMTPIKMPNLDDDENEMDDDDGRRSTWMLVRVLSMYRLMDCLASFYIVAPVAFGTLLNSCSSQNQTRLDYIN